MKLHYDWNLANAKFSKDKGTVFSCFACGGGSTMGYKLAGFDVIGSNEIDSKMMNLYIKNHNPKYSFLESIRTFKERNDLPLDLYNLDILDGSPPCSSFSMSGNRSKDWGKEKKFNEGQENQILDTLFFDFIDLAKKLQPKIVVAENVKGLLLGQAIEYVRNIYREFDTAGYHVQHFLLDSSRMGIPQKRERVFFVAVRNDLKDIVSDYIDLFTHAPKLKLFFNEKKIPFGEIYDGCGKTITDHQKKAWESRSLIDNQLSKSKERAGMKATGFNYIYAKKNRILGTLTSECYSKIILFDEPKTLSLSEIIKASTFPSDYDFCNVNPGYVVGMSVPPLMMAKIAIEIYNQWIIKLKK